MTRPSDPGFDPRIADWLEADANTAPRDLLQVVESALPSIPQRRVFRPPWRTQPMNRFIPIAIAAFLLAALAGGVALFAGAPRTAVEPSAPSVAPSLAASAATPPPPYASSLVTNLSGAFTSPLYGYSIGVDPSWKLDPARYPVGDPRGVDATNGDYITVPGTDSSIGVKAWPLDGRSYASWLADYHAQKILEVPPGCDGGDPSTWPAIAVGDRQGGWEQLCNAAQAILQVGDRAYVFGWGNDTFNASQHMPPSDFKRLLKTVTFAAAAVGAPVPTRFTSPLYGYSIGMGGDWTAKAATIPADDPKSTDDTAMDAITVTGTDTTIGGLAWNLGKQSYLDWATAYHDDVVANVPYGCDGGDPSTWPTIPVGDQTGFWLQKCNAAEAIVPIGKHVYVFSWGNQTFEPGKHLDPALFKHVLTTVAFGDGAAASPTPKP